MGSICVAKHPNLASITQSDIEVAEEQAINDQVSTMSCNFISTLELQFKSITSQHQIEQQQSQKISLELQSMSYCHSTISQIGQQIERKGILKNTNPHYEEELRILSQTIKQNQEEMHYEKLVNYLRARKIQGSHKINL